MKKQSNFLLVLSLASIAITMASCSNSETDSRWNYTRDEMSDFVQLSGTLTKNETDQYCYSVDYNIPLLNHDLTASDFLLFDVDTAQSQMEEQGKEYADYALLSSIAISPTGYTTSEDKCQFSIDFSADTFKNVGVLIAKDVTYSGEFIMAGIEAIGKTISNDPQGEWEEKYAEDSPTWSSTGRPIIQILAGVGSIIAGAAMATVNPVAIVGGIFSIFTTIGDAFGTSGASIADVMEKLKDLDSKITDIGNKIEINHQQLLTETVRTQAMVDSVLLNQCEAAITEFTTQYLKPIDTYNRTLSAKLADLYKNFVSAPRTIQLSLSKTSDGEWASSSLAEMDEKKVTNTIEVTSWPRATEFLSNNKEILKNGFIDAMMEDIISCVPSSMCKDGLSAEFIGKAAEAMAGELLLKEYFENNKDEALKLNSLVVDFAKRFNGDYGTSVLSHYLSRLSYMYNFAGEIKSSITSLVANFKQYLDFNAARAMEACEYAGYDCEELWNNYKRAREAMTNAYKNVKEMKDNYAFTVGSSIDGNFYKAIYNTYYTNPGDDCVLHVDFKLTEFTRWSDSSITSKETQFSDHNYLGETDMMRLATRYHCIQGFDEEINKKDYANYLSLYCNEMSDALSIYQKYLYARWIGTDCYRFFTGSELRGLNSGDQSMIMTCQAQGNNDSYYFSKGQTYYYQRSRTSSAWSGEIAETVYMSASNGNSMGKGKVAAWARYAENHWYWIDDEWWSFIDNPAGNYFFMMEVEA